MSKWKTKLFGDNHFNFYGWIIGGIGICAGSLFFAIKAIDAGASRSPTCMALLAVYLVMVGKFCLALQNYWSRLAEKLDKQSDLVKKDID